ncbi:MAG TPA: 50S ribosomal protein L29 [Alphaproteobacteria bacterium]|nr:50S ribosomal protein L29 [Alphaproteobacteria bacterium]
MAKAKTTNKAENLSGKSQDELSALLLDLRKKQMDMRFQQAGGQLQNTSEIRKVRRTIAQVKTVMSQHANAAQSAK